MPKVISRSVVSTDRPDAVQHTLLTYHCICGSMVLIVDKPLESLPQRKTDGARFLDSARRKFKLLTLDGPLVRLAREDGVEKQHRLKCKKCGLPIAYQTEKGSSRYFLLDGALLLPGETPDLSGETAAVAADEGGASAALPRTATRGQGKYGSTSIATATAQEEQELEAQEAGKSYEADASVVHRIMSKQQSTFKRGGDSAQAAGPAAKTPKRRGTLLTD